MKSQSLRSALRRPVHFSTLLLGGLVALNGCGRDNPKQNLEIKTATPAFEAACADGVDNDRDGTLDCDDRDCQSPGGECKAAPELDRTVATTLWEAARYLYGGDNPLQKEADSTAFERRRIAMLRGRVIDADGAPLAGVKVSIQGHTEYGYTYSRGDGLFDMAVNGGARLVIDYALAEHLPVQRSVYPGWQRYLVVPDAGMVESAANATVITANSSETQVMLGDPREDSYGPRQPLVVIEPNTAATAMLANGDEQALSSLTVTATEYPVSASNSYAPGSANSTGGLSYGLEFVVKEADAAGAEHVAFSKPVSLYVEDLGNMPVGKQLAVRHYDRATAQWEPGIRGQVIELLDTDGESASIDTDGDGAADDDATLERLGITESDRIELAKRYDAKQRLWHAELEHFSGHDIQAQGQPPAGATAPVGRGIVTKPFDNPTVIDGMVVEYQASTYSEPVAGTPYSLHYQANRTLSYQAGLSIDVPLVGDTLPANIKSIISRVTIADRTYEQRFTNLGPNLRHSVTWDGRDAVGRLLQGQQVAEVSIGYVYPDAAGGKAEAIVPISFDVSLGAWDARAFGLGGFSLDVHHSYDPARQIVYFGDGSQRSGENIALAAKSASNDATFSLGTPDSLIVAADGSLILSDDQQNTLNFGRIIKIGPDGTPTVLFGDGATGQAANVQLTQPAGIVTTSNGQLIVADIYDNKIVRIEPSGSVETLVSGDSTLSPIVLQPLNRPDGMALGPRDELYFVDTDKVYRLEGSQLEVVAGGGTETIDGGFATKALLATPSGLVVDKRTGDIYVSERKGHRVRKIDPSGTITTVAGTQTPGFSGDGDVAQLAQLNDPHGLALDPAGRLYIVDQGNGRIRRVTPDGIIQTVIGGGTSDLATNTLAVNLKLDAPDGIAAGPDGSLYIAQKDTVVRAYLGMTQINQNDFVIPSVDGSTLYRFDMDGKHLQTIDALTSVTLFKFEYDVNGLLRSIYDRDGNQTMITRGSSGRATGIVSPFGQKTEFSLNANGDTGSITDALQRTTTIAWDPANLVGRIEGPKQKAIIYNYDPTGRILDVSNPTGYKATLARTDIANGWQVDITAPAGTTGYAVQQQGGIWTKTLVAIDKTKTILVDAGANMTQQAQDGTKFVRQFVADTNFGSQVLRPNLDTLTLPSGKSLVTTWGHQLTFPSNSNVLELISFKQWSETNGRHSEAEYTRAPSSVTQTSPMGKKTQISLNSMARPSSMTSPGMPSAAWQYDSRGRPSTMTRSTTTETRTEAVDYDAKGFVGAYTNALAQQTSYTRDPMGRLQTLTEPDNAQTSWALDDADNVTSLTPPGTHPHVFSYYTTSKLVQDITPPVSPSGTGALHLDYDEVTEFASRLTKITRADSRSIEFGYDSLGRLASQKLGAATINFYFTNGHMTRINRTDGVTLDQTFDGPLWSSSKWSGAITGDVKATYDSNLWLSSLTVNAASTVSFKYDNDGGLTSATSTVGSVAFNRDATTGRISGIDVGNTTSQQQFTDFGELAQLSVNASGATLFEQRIVSRDLLGRITHLTEVVQGVAHDVSYEYDLGGRLSKQTRDGVPTTYTYDLNGNRTGVQVGSAVATAATFDPQDRILTHGSVTFTHDAHGDLKLRNDGTKSLAPEYDELGNLMRATVTDGAAKTTVEYTVDGLGRRVARRINGQFDRAWLYRDSLRPVAEIDSAGVFTHFVYSSNNALSGAPDALIRAGVFYRVVKDHLGSVRLVVNAQSGAVAQSVNYDAYGRVLSETGAGFQPFGFAGGLYDAATKLVRFGARDYDPETGRWTNKDPIGFAGQQGNQYLYVDGEPVNRWDPSGLLVWAVLDRAKGTLTVTDLDTHEKITVSAFTGLKDTAESQPNGPIPSGIWEILHHAPNLEWFRLDYLDLNPRDNVHAPTGRNGFRLHSGTRSLGCVTVPRNSWRTWLGIFKMIRRTRSVLVRDNTAGPLDTLLGRGWVVKYGDLEVR